MHTPVLSKEVVEVLSLEPGNIYFDATTGTGGHAELAWKYVAPNGVLCGIDADESAISIARERLELIGAKPKLTVLNFRNIDKAPEILGINAPNAILFDLGWNKLQFDTPEGKVGRGFSFQKDEPLRMTFNTLGEESDLTADDIVNLWEEENLETIISSYGEERYSRKIAKAIVEARQRGKIKTSKELAEIVRSAMPVWSKFQRIDPATRTFQALRIAVNDELQALEEGLTKAFAILAVGGRMAIISFHSLEDRIVKRAFRALEGSEKVEILNKKPITASEEEIILNPRSRSAKLRAIKKLTK